MAAFIVSLPELEGMKVLSVENDEEFTMGDQPEQSEKALTPKAVENPFLRNLNDIKPSSYWEKAGAETFKTFSADLVDQGIMPPLDKSDVLGTMAKAAEAQVGKSASIPGDHGASSGSLASMVAKFADNSITLNANIRDLVTDLTRDHKWQLSEYELGDPVPPGALLVSDFERPVGGRNMGIVDSTGANAIFDTKQGDVIKAPIQNSRPPFTWVLTPPKDS